jgi:hypothetical protein
LIYKSYTNNEQYIVIIIPSSKKVVADLDVSKIQFIQGTAEKINFKIIQKTNGITIASVSAAVSRVN